MALADDVACFADELQGAGVTTEVTVFPSGAVMLNARCERRLFVLAYTPSWPSDFRFGVDEALADEGIGTGYRFGFPDFESAKAKLVSMLQEAGSGSVT